MKRYSHYFLLLLLIPSLSLAQSVNKEKVVVLPYVENYEPLCKAMEEDLDRRNAVEAVEEVFKEKGYKVAKVTPLLRYLMKQGKCSGNNEETIRNVCEVSGASLYVLLEANYSTSSTGNYVNLAMTVFDAASDFQLAYKTMRSNKMYTSDIAGLTRQAFKRDADELLAEIASAEDDNGVYGNNRNKAITLKSDVDTNIPKANFVNENAVAVVIGNRNYRNPDVPAVDFAIHDARAMKMYLQQAYGFREGNIIYVEDATQASFNAIFGTDGNPKGKLYNYVKAGKSDVFVFYSGHGAPNPETNEGYFVPVDTDPSLIQHNGYSLNTFYTNLGEVPYRSLTVLLDACFSGASEKGMLLKNISPVFIKTQNKVMRDEKAMVFASASADQVASWYPEKQHGLFTYFFLKGIQGYADADQNGLVSLDEMGDYLNSNVVYMARRLNNREQNPQVIGVIERTVYSKDQVEQKQH
ncbi:DUF6175 family protein [Limibacter armeniacum]|uniref:DUF6175 family protein n=1 Tax=Limibacter armeniacum TaxID=466084 RepID=UPI002FE5345A